MDRLHTPVLDLLTMAPGIGVVPSFKIDDVAVDRPQDIDESNPDFVTRSHGEQPSLFATEDLIIPESIKGLRKAVSAIHAVPLKAEHNHTLNTRRLFDACILVAQLDFRKRGREQVERIRKERIAPLFETRVTDLARLASIPGKNFERLHDDLNKLFEMSLQWNIVGEDAEVAWEMKSHFLSSLGFGKGLNRGLIRFAIDPAILDIVLEPRHWATLSLEVLQGLGTPSSYALYQNAWRYVNTNAKVTAALPTETWIQLLVGPSRYVKDDPATGRVSINYGDFKRRVLTEAISRVNESQALNYTLELKEHLSGKRVSKLQFRFIPKKQGRLELPMNWPEEGLRVLANLGFSEANIADMSQSHSYEEVAESLARLKLADERLRAEGRPISSRKAYFTGILGNVSAGAGGADIDDARIESESRAQEAAKAARERQDRMLSAFTKHQGDVAIKRLFELDADRRVALFAEFEASPEGAKARLLIERGWTPKNVGALSMFRTWLAASHPDIQEELQPNPEDKTIEAWMAWRLDAASDPIVPG